MGHITAPGSRGSQSASSALHGAGSPVGVTTPTAAGVTYTDTTGDQLWAAYGAGNTQWFLLPSTGNAPVSTAVNYTMLTNDALVLVTAAGKTITLPVSPNVAQLYATYSAAGTTHTVAPSSGTVNGAANTGAISGLNLFVFDGTNWEWIGQSATTIAESQVTSLVSDLAAKAPLVLATKGDIVGFSTVSASVPIGTDGQVLTADSTQTLGLKWGPPRGQELGGGYAEITANSTVSATTMTAIAGLSVTVTCDGVTPIKLIFDGYAQLTSAGRAFAFWEIEEGGTQLVTIGTVYEAQFAEGAVHRERRLIPTAGSHTYLVRASVQSGGQTVVLNATATSPVFLQALYC